MRPFSVRLTELEVTAVKSRAMAENPGRNEGDAIRRWAQRLVTNAANEIITRQRTRLHRMECTCPPGDKMPIPINPLCPVHGDPRDTNIIPDVEIGNRLADSIPGWTDQALAPPPAQAKPFNDEVPWWRANS